MTDGPLEVRVVDVVHAGSLFPDCRSPVATNHAVNISLERSGPPLVSEVVENTLLWRSCTQEGMRSGAAQRARRDRGEEPHSAGNARQVTKMVSSLQIRQTSGCEEPGITWCRGRELDLVAFVG